MSTKGLEVRAAIAGAGDNLSSYRLALCLHVVESPTAAPPPAPYSRSVSNH